jgi:predicted protein tyrosine phosphatase
MFRLVATVVAAELMQTSRLTPKTPTTKNGISAEIHVCSLEAMPQLVVATGARHLVTVINKLSIPPTPDLIPQEGHLRLALNDITAPQEGLVHPNAEHIETLIAFARAWNRQGPLVVHCWAGISRSTAAAFITLCVLNPPGTERHFAQALRAASPTATPNFLMVELADDLLGAKGRMIDAVEEIGSGEMAMAGTPFSLPSVLSHSV